MLRKKARYFGKDERPAKRPARRPVKRPNMKGGYVLSDNPDARKNGFDSRNGDIVIKDAQGNVKKVVKNKAQFKQCSGDWETVKRAR